MTQIVLRADRVHELIVDALVASRTSHANAASVAAALVGAELDGQGGHGLRRVPAYAAQAACGKVDGHAVPRISDIRPAVLSIDAAGGFAFPALDAAIGRLPEVARRYGIAAAGIHRSHHAGVAGLAVERLADAGLVAIALSNAPAAMAPWGGRRPLFGTDPIAFAVPLPAAAPIVIDVSLSKVARGKLMAAAQKGDAIPPDWAFDEEGLPTTDPAAGMRGTMAPLGDAKGVALALMVELLCAGLTGANYAFEQSSFFDAKGQPPGTGQLLIALDPAAFGDDALARFAVMAEAVSNEPGARLPGARRHALREKLTREGIPLDAALVEDVRGIARR